MTSRRVVSLRRTVALSGPLGGAAFFLFIELTVKRLFGAGPVPSLIFGEYAQWPFFLKGFTALNLVATCFFFWLMCHILIVKTVAAHSDMPDAPQEMNAAVSIFVAGGSFAAFGVSAIANWYAGVEWFFIGGTALLVIAIASIAFKAFMSLLGGYACKAAANVWSKIRHTGPAQPLVKGLRYLHADDIADDPADRPR